MTTVLVIDDDRSVRHLIAKGLAGVDDFSVVSAADGAEGMSLLESEQPSVALLDIMLPEYNGLELFHKIRAIDSKLPIIFITGDTSSETAIEAMRAGAFDYVSKPLNIGQLRKLTASAARARQMMDQPVALPVTDGEIDGESFVGTSERMIEVYKDIGRVAAQSVTVLVSGESGSGKELVARALVNHSDRRDKPYVAVNCAAIPDQLLESELFGHEKGAFTGAENRRIGRFEQCHGGTIFLDEVGDMSPVTQGKVLRLLQDQTFERVGGNELISTDVRIIAATNRDLSGMVQDGSFREDLLYRLNSFTISLPPLRDRRDDIPLLLEYFLRRARDEMHRPELHGIAPDALEQLIAYDWPGNVRQLQSVIRQSLLNTTGTVISSEALPHFILQVGSSGNYGAAADQPTAANGQSPPTAPKSILEDNRGDGGLRSQSAVDGVATCSPTLPSSVEEADVGHESAQRVMHDTADSTPHESSISGNATADAFAGWDARQDSARVGDYEPNTGRPDLGQSDREEIGVGEEFFFSEFIQQRLRDGSHDLYAEALEQMERRLFTQVLTATGGNQSKTAEILGITRGKVRDRIAAFNIQLDRKVSVGS